MTGITHYRGGHIFTADDAAPWAESLVVHDGLIRYVGSDLDADAYVRSIDASSGHTEVVQLGGARVIPGIIEAHSHIGNLGRSLTQLDLLDAGTLDEMQRRIAEAAHAPGVARVFGRNWLLGPFAGAEPHRDMIDAVAPDVPVYLTSNDAHSAWLNTAALREMGIDDATPDPAGGTIVRDEAGRATGLLLETAALALLRDAVERVEDDARRDASAQRALAAYRAAGVTAVADLGLRGAELAALERAWNAGTLPLPVAGYLRVETADDADTIAQRVKYAITTRERLDRAAEARGERDPMLRISGIKIWIDGVIDSGTAALSVPFADGTRPAALWLRERLVEAVTLADAAGLQVAMHAIGDAAVSLAIDAVRSARETNGDSGIAHRIEHLEVVDPACIARLVSANLIASVQPVHSDPLVQDEWRRRLGDDRVERGYPWREFDAAGAVIAIGTDAPTAPYRPLPNLFIAATRRSASQPTLPANHPELRLSLERALLAATRDAAFACGWGSSRGILQEGYRADFLVLAQDPFADGPEVLRDADPARVVIGGVVVSRTP